MHAGPSRGAPIFTPQGSVAVVSGDPGCRGVERAFVVFSGERGATLRGHCCRFGCHLRPEQRLQVALVRFLCNAETLQHCRGCLKELICFKGH